MVCWGAWLDAWWKPGLAQEGVPGQGCERGIPAHWDDLHQGTAPPRWSIACLRRVLDHHISFDYFVPSFSFLFLLLSPSKTHHKSFFNSKIGPVWHLMSMFFLWSVQLGCVVLSPDSQFLERAGPSCCERAEMAKGHWGLLCAQGEEALPKSKDELSLWEVYLCPQQVKTDCSS